MQSPAPKFVSDYSRLSIASILDSLRTLWDFSRPHTILGSTISILVLYLIAIQGNTLESHFTLFLYTWISALGCNVFITGLNQLYDIEIDRINKPFLPLADGRLTKKQGWQIVIISLILCISVAAVLSKWLLFIMVAILTIGAFYSLPLIRFKKHHLPAALSIVVVRGILVNLAIGYWFEYMISGNIQNNSLVIPLTIVITAFSFVIAWFKDLNDIEGDQKFEVKTLAILYNEKFALTLGSVLVVASLLISIYLTRHLPFLIIGQVILILGYFIHLYLSDLRSTAGLYRFYLKFWVFFIAVYLLFGIQTFIN